MGSKAVKESLLIVDDEPDILEYLERVFRKEYKIYRAESGRQALVILQTNPIDILITDQKMPGMSGIELFERLASVVDYSDNMVKILLSGYAEGPEIIKAVEKLKIHQYIVKPVDTRRLREAVQEAQKRWKAGLWAFSENDDSRTARSKKPKTSESP